MYFRRLLSLFHSSFLGRIIKKKWCFGKKFRKFKILKMITWISKLFFFSHTPSHKVRFQLRDTFFHCLSLFSEFFFQSNPHSEDPFLVLGNSRFHKRFFIYGLLFFSRARQYSIDTRTSLSRFFYNMRIAEIHYSKKHRFHTQPPKQNLYLFRTL